MSRIFDKKTSARAAPAVDAMLIDSVRRYLHPNVELLDGWIIRIPKFAARSDETSTFTIDLSAIWLPSNSVYPEAQPLSQQTTLAACVVLSLNAYWQAATAQKSRHSRAKLVVANIAKFLEYAWMNDKFVLGAWSQEDFDALAKKLGGGGWQHALRIKERLTDYFAACLPSEVSSFICQDSGIRQGNINTRVFQRRLGTNVQGKEVKNYHTALAQLSAVEEVESRKELLCSLFGAVKSDRPSQSTLREIFSVLNYAYDLPLEVGFDVLPYVDGHGAARKLGVPNGRTANLTAEQAIQLFAESFRWVYTFGGPLVNLLSELCSSAIRAHSENRNVIGFEFDEILRKSEWYEWLNQNLPAKITAVDAASRSQDGLSFRSALLCLMSAAFFLSATMNARRKDEVAHRRFGLHRGCVKTVDHELALHEAEFYIEKTFCDYMSFFVNQTTRDVVDLLERIQDQFDRVDVAFGWRNPESIPTRERSLFTYRRFSRIEGVGRDRCWFNFESRLGGNADRFIKFAVGTSEIPITPHMFRRAYALIFYYRYANSTLQALSSQMRHFSLATTQVYVTDPRFIADAASIGKAFEAYPERRRRAYDHEVKALQKQLKIVGDELLIDTVLSIVEGQASIGGYARFVRFIHSKIGSLVEFKTDDLRRTAEQISAVLRQRGHSPTTMPHGQCMAGETRSVHLARCSVPSRTALHRADASPSTCFRCAYHFSNKAYLENIRRDLRELDGIAAKGGTLEATTAARSALNLRGLIQLYEARLYGGDDGTP